MNRETIFPKDHNHWLSLRTGDLTSTSIPALFNASPYLSRFECWHRIVNGVNVEIEQNDSMRWGSRLEPVIAMGIAEDEGWQIRKKPEYMRLVDHRIGSSFDYETDAPALLEIKSVSSRAFRQGWRETEFGLEAAPHIEIQVQVECLVSGLGVCYIGALTDNDQVHVLRREFQPDVGEAIIAEARKFFSAGEPAPDFARDSEFIAKRLFGFSAEGKSVDADEEIASLCREYAGYKSAARVAEDNAEAARAKLFMRIGDAERIEAEDFYALARTTKETVVASFTRKPSRPLRIYERKPK